MESLPALSTCGLTFLQTYMLGGLEPSLHRTELFSAKGCFNLRTTPSYAGILNNDQTIGKAFMGKRAISQTI